MSDNEQKSVPRREFLKTAGIASAAAGVAIAADSKPAKAKKIKTKGHAGYQETSHVKTYYELARF